MERGIGQALVGSFLSTAAVRFGDREGFVCSETGRRFTFGQTNERCNRLASGLTTLGLKKGDVVARLEAADLEANVAQAEARVKGTEADLAEAKATQVSIDLEENRLRALFEQGLGTRQDADRAAPAAAAGRARIASLAERILADRAQVAYARAVLANSVVVAPFDGVVLTKDAIRACQDSGCSTLTTSTAVTLYSGQFVAQSEFSVVTRLAPDSGKWKVV